MKERIKEIVLTLVLGTACFSGYAYALIQTFKAEKPDVVLPSDAPMGARAFYDKDNDGTLDNMVHTELLCVGSARGVRRRIYSVEEHPKEFLQAQKEYNQLE